MTEAVTGEGGGVRPRIEVVRTEAATEHTKEILYGECNSKTALFLPGGKTPVSLFESLASDAKLQVGEAAMVDERFTPEFDQRNETMIRQSGLVSYFESRGIPFHPIYRAFSYQRLEDLPIDLKYPNRSRMTEAYNETVQRILAEYQGIALLGLGADGHIASLPAGVSDLSHKLKLKSRRYVEDYGDFPIKPRERITLTPRALSEMKLVILLVLGKGKKAALELILKKGEMGEVPGRFLTTAGMAPKTIIITDQTPSEGV